MQQQSWILPGGYIDAAGAIHREVELTALTGREEELLARMDTPSAELVTEIIARCVRRVGAIEPVTAEIARGLLVGDRQYILLLLRQLTFGDKVQATISCPWRDCGERIDIDFNISEVPVTRCEQPQAFYRMQVEPDMLAGSDIPGLQAGTPLEIEFRLPNGADQEVVGPYVAHNQSEALTLLLTRCIKSIGQNEQAVAEIINALCGKARHQIECEMEAHAPSVELTMETDCPECGRSFIAPFELQDFFFGELKVSTDLLYREVHYLAFHYHWSEEEIMRMPRERRRQYLDVLTDEIERLNDAAG